MLNSVPNRDWSNSVLGRKIPEGGDSNKRLKSALFSISDIGTSMLETVNESLVSYSCTCISSVITLKQFGRKKSLNILEEQCKCMNVRWLADTRLLVY